MQIGKIDLKVLTAPNISNGIMSFGEYNFTTGRYTPNSVSIPLIPTWNRITGKPNFKAIAISGDYNDLINKPSGAGVEVSHVNADWLASGGPNAILNKPDLSDYTEKVEFDNFAASIDPMVFDVITIELSNLGGSIIENGKIKNELIDFDFSQAIPTDYITQNDFEEALNLKASVSYVNNTTNLLTNNINNLQNQINAKADQGSLTTISNNLLNLTNQVNNLTLSGDILSLTGRIEDLEDLTDFHSSQIVLKADQTSITALGNSIDNINDTLALKASQANMTTAQADILSLDGRVTFVENAILALPGGGGGGEVTMLQFNSLSSTVSTLGSRVTSAETAIQQNANNILLKASQSDINTLSNRITANESSINIQNGLISSKASQSSVNTLTNRVNVAESEILQNANNITLKVSQTDFTGGNIMNKINLSTSGIKIQANRIDLEGAVTFSTLDAGLQGTLGGLGDDLADLASIKNYINNVLPGELEDLEGLLDGVTEQYFYTTDPDNGELPTSDWITNSTQEDHLGDIYYNTTSGKSWRYVKESGSYLWKEIVNADLALALNNAAAAQATANSKRRVFSITPYPPYDLNDLWVQGAGGDIMICTTAKGSGDSYSSGDWVKAVKYTDDTTANAVQSRINSWASDSNWSPTEKSGLKTIKILEQVKANQLASEASYYGINVTNFNNALNAYLLEIDDILESELEVVPVSGTFTTKQTAYKTELNNLLTAINTAQQTKLTKTDNLKGLAYQTIEEVAVGGQTLINGGKINTILLDALAIKSTIINAGYIQTIDLNADKITSGTINTARLDTNALKAELITANNINALALNASSITTGTLSTDRLNIGSLVVNNTFNNYINSVTPILELTKISGGNFVQAGTSVSTDTNVLLRTKLGYIKGAEIKMRVDEWSSGKEFSIRLKNLNKGTPIGTIKIDSSGNWFTIDSSNTSVSRGAFNLKDVFKVQYDGYNINYIKNNSIVYYEPLIDEEIIYGEIDLITSSKIHGLEFHEYGAKDVEDIVDNKISTLKTANRNLFRNSFAFGKTDNWSTSDATITADTNKVKITMPSGSSGEISTSVAGNGITKNWKPNTEYILQFDLQGITLDNLKLEIKLEGGYLSNIVTLDNNTSNFITYTVKFTTINSTPVDPTFKIKKNDGTGLMEFWLTNCMIAEGNLISSFVIAPEENINLISTQINDSIGDVTDSIIDAASDNLITAAELIDFRFKLNELSDKTEEFTAIFNTVYSNPSLSGSVKTELNTAHTSLTNIYNSLKNILENALRDGEVTSIERNSIFGASGDGLTSGLLYSYRLAVSTFKTKLEAAYRQLELKTIDTIQIGGENLLLGSDVATGGKTSASIATYNIAGGSSTLQTGETVTVTIWGNLGSDRTKFLIYSSGNVLLQTEINKTTNQVKPGVYRKTFEWNVGGGMNTFIEVYQDSGSVASNITKIQLEKGNIGTDWSPASNDLVASVSKYADDGIITALEKKSLKIVHEDIKKEYAGKIEEAGKYSITTTNYTNAYNALNSFLTTLLSSISTDTTLSVLGSNRTSFNALFATYSEKLAELSANIVEVTKTFINGKAKIHNTLPSSYSAGDLLMLSNDVLNLDMTTSNWVTYYGNKIYRATNSSNILKYSDWAILDTVTSSQLTSQINSLNSTIQSTYVSNSSLESALGIRTKIFTEGGGTSGPSNYKVGDMWIPTSNLTIGSTTFKAGKAYLAANNYSGSAREADWKSTIDIPSVDGAAILAPANYLLDALEDGETALINGLILTTVVALQDTTTNTVSACISGQKSSDSAAFAAGVANFGTIGQTELVRINFDGSGKLAGGKIKWYANGSGELAGGNISWNTGGDLTVKGNLVTSTIGSNWKITANSIENPSSYTSADRQNSIINAGGTFTFFNQVAAAGGNPLMRNHMQYDGYGQLTLYSDKNISNKAVLTLDAHREKIYGGNSYNIFDAGRNGEWDIALRIKYGYIYLDNIELIESVGNNGYSHTGNYISGNYPYNNIRYLKSGYVRCAPVQTYLSGGGTALVMALILDGGVTPNTPNGVIVA